MKTEILIVSYAKDLPYLRYCLKSIVKFATGFSGVVVLVPEQEKEQMLDTMLVLHNVPSRMLAYQRVPNPAQWHLNAQLQKCHADQHCHQADFIAHMDSDCVFTQPVTPEDYFVGGKPVMCIEAYTRLTDCPWQQVTARALGFVPTHETMRRHPQVNPRGVYPALRAYLEGIHHQPFDQYVLGQKADFPWGFTEHNTIGSFARASRKWSQEYHWVDLETQPWPPHKLLQFWSLSPPDVEQPLPSGGRGLPLNEFKRLGLA
jgi:hypothetical protein